MSEINILINNDLNLQHETEFLSKSYTSHFLKFSFIDCRFFSISLDTNYGNILYQLQIWVEGNQNFSLSQALDVFRIGGMQKGLPTSFYAVTSRVVKLWSHDQIYNIIWITWENLADDVTDWNYDVITFISK